MPNRRLSGLLHSPPAAGAVWRRARPLLGTLVEIGIVADACEMGKGAQRPDAGVPGLAADAIADAFRRIETVQRCLSRFDPASDIARFNRLPAGGRIEVHPLTAEVLAAACRLRDDSDGLFDVSLGSAPHGWECDGTTLHKRDGATRLDLGGIGKGHAVDRAVERLLARGCRRGWVNAGGDLRAFGALDLPVTLRDERSGGVRPFLTLRDGACATSRLLPARSGSGAGSGQGAGVLGSGGRVGRLLVLPRARGVEGCAPGDRSGDGRDVRDRAIDDREAEGPMHVSVAAPRCLFADALTKVVAAARSTLHPVLDRHGAIGWVH